MQLLEDIYALYPRKRGKTAGMKKLKGLIIKKDGSVNKEIADKIITAIQNYREETKFTEKDYIKHFGTFMNNWEDYLEEDVIDREDPFDYIFL